MVWEPVDGLAHGLEIRPLTLGSLLDSSAILSRESGASSLIHPARNQCRSSSHRICMIGSWMSAFLSATTIPSYASLVWGHLELEAG